MANQRAENSGLRVKINKLRQRTQRLESLLAKLMALGNQLYLDQSFRQCVIELAAEGICVCQDIPEHPFIRFTLWNPRMTRITGYSMDQINRLGWYQTMYPDQKIREQARQRMAMMRKGDHMHHERWSITRADGAQRTLSISTSTAKTTDNQTHVIALMHDITDSEELSELKRTQKSLKKTMAELDKEIRRRVEAESKLKSAYRTLEEKVKRRTAVLEETNTAFKVILNQREKDKLEIAERIMANMNELVYPYLAQLRQTSINERQAAFLEILQSNLAQVTHPFANQMTSKHFNLTPMEMKVASLIRDGLPNKKIAEILGVSLNTILTHRHHIRNKLDLKNRKANLRSFLKSLD